jgi:Zn-dependent oligopeptidase
MSNSTNDKSFLDEARLNSKTRRERPTRRIVPSGIKVSKAPQLNTLINDALSIIGSQLSQYRMKADKGLTLDLKEARAIQGYMDSLVKMSKEAREAQKPEHLEHLSDAELMEIANEHLSVEIDTDEE